MPISSTLLIARVSRYDLARNRYVWLSTAGMFGFFALCGFVIAWLPLGYDRPKLLVFAGVMLVLAVIHFKCEPPTVESPLNHVGLAAIWGSLGFGLYAWAPHAVAVLVPAMFISSTTAARLIERGQIAAHYLAASIAIITPAALGIVDSQTVLGIAVVVPTIWVLGLCTVIVLEAAEAQGEELEQLVRRDPLTGVGNRRMLTEQLAEDLGRHLRVRRPLSVLAIDLDGFKAINDEIGHAAGDEVLRQVADALVRVTGDQGTVVRQGGDEFCVILPGKDPQAATRFGNAVRAELAAIPLTAGRVSAGFGSASYPQDAVHSGVLMHVADERLRANKARTTISAANEDRPDDEFGRPALYGHG